MKKTLMISYRQFLIFERLDIAASSKKVDVIQTPISVSPDYWSDANRYNEFDEVVQFLKEQNINFEDYDKFIVYVGSKGSEKIIKFLREKWIKPEQITFVMCNCNLDRKIDTIVDNLYEDATLVESECGGKIKMTELFMEIIRSET